MFAYELEYLFILYFYWMKVKVMEVIVKIICLREMWIEKIFEIVVIFFLCIIWFRLKYFLILF